MNGRIVAIRRAVFALLALFWSLLFFFPTPRVLAADSGERYLCLWSDGSQSEESYYDAYANLVGMDDGGAIVLTKDGVLGTVRAGEACAAAFRILETGTLGELLALDIAGVSRLERAALYRRYHSRLWYDGEYFAWEGDRFARATAQEARSLVFLSGDLTAARLSETGATTLYLRADAAFSAALLSGTAVERIVAEEPYRSEGGTVCLSTPGGVRLLAGLSGAKRVQVPADVYFADEGALLPCTALEEAEVPFVGNTAGGTGTLFRGEFAHLFSTGKEYRVPATLRRVRVTGGYLFSHAFYGCGMLEEIDACGVLPENVERDAFYDCPNLRLLHTPRADVRLRGEFSATVAPCGCTVYERAD